MREIKFRGWYQKEKKIYYNVHNSYDTIGISFTDLDEITPKDEWQCFGDVLQDENLSIMQYTGLKDKNGKEIYEGDIIKTVHGKICEIKYVGSSWCASDKYTDDILDGYFTERDIEIIGNIYEKPELLKEK